MKEYPTKQIDKRVLYPSYQYILVESVTGLDEVRLLCILVYNSHRENQTLLKTIIILLRYKCKKVVGEKIEPDENIICNNYMG